MTSFVGFLHSQHGHAERLRASRRGTGGPSDGWVTRLVCFVIVFVNHSWHRNLRQRLVVATRVALVYKHITAVKRGPPATRTSLPGRVMSTKEERGDFVDSLSVSVDISGRTVEALVEIRTISRVTAINFNYGRREYEFDVTKWSGNGLSKLQKLFFAYAARDPDTFGERVVDDDGYLVSRPLTSTQKRNIVFQASVDVMTTLSKIVTTHGRDVLDYAVWYRENKKFEAEMGYSSYITMRTCHCIVHQDFEAGSKTYELVEL
jgi:hypothetical protein